MPCSFTGEFDCALLLEHVGETVQQLGESQEFCSVLFNNKGCSLFMPCSSGLVKLMSGELCSCFVVVLNVYICRVLFLCV